MSDNDKYNEDKLNRISAQKCFFWQDGNRWPLKGN